MEPAVRRAMRWMIGDAEGNNSRGTPLNSAPSRYQEDTEELLARVMARLCIDEVGDDIYE